jgi:hypothetical protein
VILCKLFGSTKNLVDEVRLEMFTKKYTNKNRVIDLSALPPCHSLLIKHVKRANFVAAMWKRTESRNLDLQDITDHGWNIDGTIDYIDEVCPADVTELLLIAEDIVEELNSYGSDSDGGSGWCFLC